MKLLIARMTTVVLMVTALGIIGFKLYETAWVLSALLWLCAAACLADISTAVREYAQGEDET
jgi:hypothetical protein